MQTAMSPRTRRYLIRAGLWLVLGGVLVPAQVPPETASNFFLASSGANATILVAITISSIVRKGS